MIVKFDLNITKKMETSSRAVRYQIHQSPGFSHVTLLIPTSYGAFLERKPRATGSYMTVLPPIFVSAGPPASCARHFREREKGGVNLN